MHYEQSAILTVHNHVITRNPRISVTHDKHDKHRTWFLHINNIQEEDRGRYMCQINTVTAKTQYGYVKVVGECGKKLHPSTIDRKCCQQKLESNLWITFPIKRLSARFAFISLLLFTTQTILIKIRESLKFTRLSS